MTIRRSPHDKENPYVVINKNCIQDPDLSWNARGLLAYLLSLPNDWSIQVSHLCTIFKKKGGGRDAILSMLNELIECGYCERVQTQKQSGEFGKVEYHISEFKKSLTQPDQPVPDQPLTAEPSLTKYIDKQSNEKPPPRETLGKEETLQKNKGGGGLENSIKPLIYRNTKGEAVSISTDEIYAHFIRLPYETQVVEQAITEVKNSNDLIGNIFKYLEAICLRIHNSPKKNSVAEKKKKNYDHIPDYSQGPKANLGEMMGLKHPKEKK